MKSILLALFTLLVANLFAYSQNKLQLIAEYGAGLQTSSWYNFLASDIKEEYKTNNSRILLRIEGGGAFLYPFMWGARMKAHLVGNLGFDSRNIQVQNCDLDGREIKAQFFLIPEKAIIPFCNDTIPVPQKTFRYSVRGYDNPHLEADEVYSIPDKEGAISKTYYKLLKELLNKSPESKLLLIGYLGTNFYNEYRHKKNGDLVDFPFRKIDKPILMRKMLQENVASFTKQGVAQTRISTINGGYKDSTRIVEIWFVPKGGEIPKPKPDYFPKRKRTK